jgi:adenosylmethionine-8-amino-7-oxononanoate aminotransferase
MSNSYWQPLNMANGGLGIEITRGEQAHLYDSNGKKYVDGYSGLWNVTLGYNDEDIIEAIVRQVKQLPYVNPITLKTPIVSEVSDILCKITHDNISKIVYTCSGSEAIEAAIKISRKYSAMKGKNRKKIAVMENSYHGSYYGSMSASNYEEAEKEGYGPMLEGFISLPLPFSRKKKGNVLDDKEKQYLLQQLEEILETNKDTLCSIIIEPVLASGGVIPLFPEYIYKISEFCKTNDILFVCDEVATGFWRTGSIFCFKKYNIKPDIITISKGINNGYLPLGAVCICKKIEKLFEQNGKILFHLSTQNANPICIASALATLKKMNSGDIQAKAENLIKEFQDVISENLVNLNFVSEVRQVGLMIAIDLVQSLEGNVPIEEKNLYGIVRKCFDKGCIVGMAYSTNISSAILIFPSYIMSNNDVKEVIKIVKESIMEELHKED